LGKTFWGVKASKGGEFGLLVLEVTNGGVGKKGQGLGAIWRELWGVGGEGWWEGKIYGLNVGSELPLTEWGKKVSHLGSNGILERTKFSIT